MAGHREKELALARVYAGAIFDLAESQGQADVLLAEIQDLSEYLGRDHDFALYLSSPTVDTARRAKLIEKLFRGRYSDLFVDAMQVMNRKGRLMLISALAESYRLLHKERRGQVEVHVITAVPLGDAMRQRVREVAGRITAQEPVLMERVDESLIGGMVMRIGDRKFDMTVQTGLNTMQDALMKRAAQELHAGRLYVEGMVA